MAKPKTRESISVAMRFFILRRDKYTCRYCGAKAPDAALHVDHVLAASKGGTNDPDNLVAACIRCNIGKGATPSEVKVDTAPAYFKRFWLAGVRYAQWANMVYVGGSPECRLLLLHFASHADPFGNVEIDVSDILKTTGLSRGTILRAIRGLTAVGYIGHSRFIEGTTCAVFDLPKMSTDEGPPEHIPRRSLKDFDAWLGFSPVRDIHG